jgi:hypothetical protein
MQTQFGRFLSFAAMVAAVALSWTGQWTGWFSPENPHGYLWVFGGLVVALGLIRLIDLRIWVDCARRARLARRQAARASAEAERVATEERRQSILQALSESAGSESQTATR